MAIIHEATLKPSKRELVQAWLDQQSWGGHGDLTMLGSFRYDDPAGEVGVEAIMVRRGNVVLHVPLTYRGAPLASAEAHLVGTLLHSVLGKRWVYDAAGDPVAIGCYERALRGEQDQAVFEVWDNGRLVETHESVVGVHREPGSSGPSLTICRVVEDVPGTGSRLVAEWPGGRGVVAHC